MEIIKVAVLGIVGTLIASQLKTQKQGFVICFILAVSILIFSLSVTQLTVAVEMVNKLMAYLNGGEQYLSILLKIVGVTYICEFSAGICKDAGFLTIANQVQIFGKLFILLSGMPILIALLNTISTLGM